MARRWHSFKIVFALTYIGIVLDIVTTALGTERMSSYEQNPLGSSLIGASGWLGLALLLTSICALCYLSVRLMARSGRVRLVTTCNIVLLPVAVFRWIAVAAAVLYLAHAV